MNNDFIQAQKSLPVWLAEAFLLIRGVFFAGSKYSCPCCGWKMRAFTKGGRSFKARHLGYCPRCDAKARHRRDWLYLEQHTNLFTEHLRLLHVSPRYSLSRQLAKMENLDYVGIDLYPRRNISIQMDLTWIPIQSDTFDAAICIHVLEHVQQDYQAIQELFRVLKSGSWAMVTVPVHLDQPTFEDSSITSPEGRRNAFGEKGHFRLYGYDLADRLRRAGFTVNLDLGAEVDQKTKQKYGLRDDENIFFCTKP